MVHTIRAVVRHCYKPRRQLLLNSKQPIQSIGIFRVARELVHGLAAGGERQIGRGEGEVCLEEIHAVARVGGVIRCEVEAEPHG